MGHPVNFGHEGVSVIEALGAGVTTDWAGTPVSVGDTVYWMPGSGFPAARSEGQVWPPPATVPNPAAYQDYATLSPSNVFYRIPEDTPPEAVIAFGCAMPTALGGQSIIGRLGATHHSDYLTVIRLAQRFGHRLGFPDLITHRVGLADTEGAISAMRAGEAIKAIVLPGLDRH